MKYKRIIAALLAPCCLTACGNDRPDDLSDEMYNYAESAIRAADAYMDNKLSYSDATCKIKGLCENSKSMRYNSDKSGDRLVSYYIEILYNSIEYEHNGIYTYADLSEVRDNLAHSIGDPDAEEVHHYKPFDYEGITLNVRTDWEFSKYDDSCSVHCYDDYSNISVSVRKDSELNLKKESEKLKKDHFNVSDFIKIKDCDIFIISYRDYSDFYNEKKCVYYFQLYDDVYTITVDEEINNVSTILYENIGEIIDPIINRMKA